MTSPSDRTASAVSAGKDSNPHPYTCNSCQVAFRSSDLQRTHMRTDWHRYNIKRRVASLPPIPSSVFNDKVLHAQADSRAAAARASFERVCIACQKTYYSENAYTNHLNSQKHRLRSSMLASEAPSEVGDTQSLMSAAISLGEPINVLNESETGEGQKPDMVSIDNLGALTGDMGRTTIVDDRAHRVVREGKRNIEDVQKVEKASAFTKPTNPHLQCVFCNQVSAELATNVSHMSRQHGLFVPEKEYLVDMGGLVSWLWERVADDHECLYCHKLRHSTAAIQGHMKDMGHCKIAYEDEEDMILVGQFYDFRSTYSDEESDGTASEDGDEASWESDSDVDSVKADNAATSATALRRIEEINPSFSAQTHALVADDELHLPSGKIAGHRSMAKYFRQNLYNRPSVSEIAERGRRRRMLDGPSSSDEEDQDARRRSKAMVSRANGGLGMLGVSDAKKNEVQATEKRELQRAQRAAKQYEWGTQKRANKQKHFRDPLLQ